MARTRFAPSPTGSLHVGGVRTALYCLLEARRSGGAYVLRIEDTDRARSTEAAERGILDDLAWCGLEGDEGPDVPGASYGPYRQSERRDLYGRYADQLLDEGKAYLAWETPAELTAMRKAAEAAKENFRYRRRAYTEAEITAFEAEGRVPVVRFAAATEAVTVHDLVLGEVTAEPEALDDFVIIKADGWPTYHFAVVIDDHLMGITTVMRGQDHLMNTHRHVQLYAALGWDPPEHAHLSIIFNPAGGKMSKRDKAKAAREAARQAHKAEGHEKGDWSWLAQRADVPGEDLAVFMKKKSDAVDVAAAIAGALGIELPLIEVMDFRRGGYLPEALVNYMALLGWSPGDDREIMSPAEMVEAFTIDRLTKTPARFDGEKLAWVNAQYMQALPIDDLLARMEQWLEVADSRLRELGAADRAALLEMYRARARTFSDIERLGGFFFEAPQAWATKAVKKHLDKGDGWTRLDQARGALHDLGRWEAPSLKTAFEALSESTGVPVGKFAQPVRVAVTGTGVSPEIMDTLAFLGRDASLDRITRCLATRSAAPQP